MTNVAASRKFRAKRVYFDDQHMLLRTADYRTLGLVHDMNDHNVLKHQVMKHANKKNNQILKHANNEVMKRSTSEKMQMKKIMQISSSKQTNNRTSDRVKNKGDKTYQRANNTQSHSRIKFKLFSLISSK